MHLFPNRRCLNFTQWSTMAIVVCTTSVRQTSTKYYARSILHYERSTLQFQNCPFKHLTQFPLSIKAQIGTFPSHFPQIFLFWNSNLLCTHQTLILTYYPKSTMAPKIAKKVRSKVAHEKGNAERGDSSRGEKRPSSSRPPISPASKRSKPLTMYQLKTVLMPRNSLIFKQRDSTKP